MGTGRRVLILAALILIGLTHRCEAHPFGNLRIDATSQLSISPTRLSMRYLLYLPEASAYGQLKLMDTNGDGTYSTEEKQAYLDKAVTRCLQNIKVQLNGQAVELKVVDRQASVEPGVGGLSSLRITYLFESTLPPTAVKLDQNHLTFVDDNFTGTPGWKEIAAAGQDGVRIISSPTKPETAIDALQNDADIVYASHGGALGAAPPAVPPVPGSAGGPPLATTQGATQLTGLLASEHLDAKIILVALGIAFCLGALHALTPGHGKTIVGAYLIGSRGTVAQAFLLGGVVTFTHTISVILLGLICLYAFQYMVPEKLIPWLGCVSGLLISIMGAYLFVVRRRESAPATVQQHSHDDHHHHAHEHSHPHAKESTVLTSHAHGSHTHAHESANGKLYSHDPDHGHSHSDDGGHSHGTVYHSHHVPDKVTLWSLLALGVSGGIVPCPDALVVLLSAIALHKIALGLLVIVAFSFGLAAVLIAVGVAMVTAGRVLEKYYPQRAFLSRVTSLTYVFIFFVGLTIAAQSLISAGILPVHLNV